MTPLVLASTSRWRKELLTRLGHPFESVDPGVDEAPAMALGLAPRELVLRLAEEKARAVAALRPGCLVLGGDQVACVDGLVLGKPGTAERACAQLRAMAGRTHELVTGLALVLPDGTARTALDVHRLTMRPLSDAQIASYVARERPLDAAGSYMIEGLGITLFTDVQGRDFTAILGLPLTVVTALLLDAGIDVLA